ncbi:MAG: acyl-CoA dehydrogenase [Deltaproteobacteria bacterium HGW-Deltaproteobacteria-19]|jgi:acyl-CoA dehydrogenase|nr:MAG: acyl-CoA dehydrogenase [Deltaproteobacteria bacterium HGW-Deltaproteobacteria-19]
MLGFDLTPEQVDIQRKARDFALREVLPLAWPGDARDELPLSLLRKAFEEGISSAGVPREYGGKGYGLLEMVLMVEEVAAACSGVATSIFDNSLGLTPLVLSRNEPLKQHYLSELAREAKWICFATSEPTMGSDVASLRCRVTEQGGGYVLNGTKYWVTNGGIADYISVFATTDPEKGHEGIGGFLAHLDWDGVTRSAPIPKLGQRASNTTGIHFRDVFVPGKNVLAPPGKGFVLAMKTFTRTRPAIGALAVGAARSAMEFALDYARKRQAFGTALSGFQNTQFRLAEMYQKLETARLLTWKSAWEVDSGMDATTSSAISKMFATEAAWQIVDDAMQIMGGYGYTRMFPMEKLLRDVRLLKIYEGTSEIQRLILAATVLGSYRPVMPSLHDLPVTGIPPPGEDEAGEGVFLWRCRVCGNVHVGREPPESCPYCFFPASAFKKVVPGQR